MRSRLRALVVFAPLLRGVTVLLTELPFTLASRFLGVPAGLLLLLFDELAMLKWPAALDPLAVVRILAKRSRTARGVGLSIFSAWR